MSEDDLAPISVFTERLAKQQEFFNSKMMTDDANKYIIKNRKGDIDICDLSAKEVAYEIPSSLEVNHDKNGGKADMSLTRKKTLEDSMDENTSENEYNYEMDDEKTSQKDIIESFKNLSWDKFRVKCSERYEEYLPVEIATELQQELC